MRLLAGWLGVAVFLLAPGVLAGAPQDKPPDKYQTLLARLKIGDKTVDFTELRQAYADSPEYASGCDPDESKAMLSALRQGDYAQALALAKKILGDCYLDIQAHQVAYVASRKMQHAREANFHRFIVHGLLEAIFHSGNGKSPETAWVVLSTDEEYVILRVLRLAPASQSLLNSGGHAYDRLDAVDPRTQQKVSLYFNIDRPMQYLQKAISK
jgi:Domain of unknown function (DUF4919)